MKTLLFVFLGGGLGSCCRYLISKWLNPLTDFIPYGTLSANILSCIILGIGVSLFESRFADHNALRVMILIGFCGGFSTFSTFSNEAFQFLKNSQYINLTVYVIGSLVLCNLAIGLGLWFGKLVIK